MKLSEVTAQSSGGNTGGNTLKLSQVMTRQPYEPKADTSIGRTILDQTEQGATFGLGDEIMDALGAFGAKAYDATLGDGVTEGMSIGDLYDEARQNSQKRLSAQMQERPALSIGSNLAGALITGGKLSTTKPGMAVANWTGKGATGMRIAKGAAVGASSGAAYGFGTGEGSVSDRLENAGEGAVYGAAFGAAVPAAGATARGIKEAVVPRVDDALKPLAKRAKDLGIPLRLDQISPTRARRTIQKVSQEVPFSGADDFEAVQRTAFNRAVAKTIGQDADNLSPEIISRFLDDTSVKFSSVAKGKQIKVGSATMQRLDAIAKEAADNTTQSVVDLVGKNVQKVKTDLLGGTVDGSKIASLRSDLVRRLPSIDPQAREYVGKMVDVIDETIAPALNKTERTALQQARREWRNFKTIEPLLEKSMDGSINPVELMNRVKASRYIKASRSKIGDDELVDLARIGKQFLPKQGGSDTFQKLAVAGGGGGLAATFLANPALGTALALKAGTGIGLNRAFQRGYNSSQGLVNRAINQAPRTAAMPSLAAPVSGGALTAEMPPVVNRGGNPTRVEVYPGNANPMRQALSNLAKDETGGGKIPDIPAARNWMKDNLQGNTYRNAVHGLDIVVTRQGINETLQYNAKNLDSVQDIPSLLENAKIVRTVQDKKFPEHTNAIFMEAVSPRDGMVYEIMLKQQKNDQGRFYFHRMKRMVAPATGIGLTTYPDASDATNSDNGTERPRSQPDADLLDRISRVESNGNPTAKSPTSSAFGIHQYTEQTWKDAVRKYGKQLGVTIGDIADPRAQYAITSAMIRNEYVPSLSRVLGRLPTDGEIYLAHFAGQGGARRLLKAPDNAIAARLLPKAAKSNPSIFFDGRRPRKVSEVLSLINSKVS